MRVRPVAVVLALVAASCTPASNGPQEPVDAGRVPSTLADPSSGVESGSESKSPAGLSNDIPPLPLLTVTSEFGEPGGIVAVEADRRLAGEIVLIGPDGALESAEMVGGAAHLAVPANTPPGRYGLSLNHGAAWGELTVLNPPGVALVGSRYAADSVELLVHGLPLELESALELSWADGTTQRMIPHPLAGLAPVPPGGRWHGFGEGRHRVSLPSGFEGAVRVVAGAPGLIEDPNSEQEPQIVSDGLSVGICGDPTLIVGDLGSDGVVSIHGSDGAQPTVVKVDGGPFSLTAVPGVALVSAIRADGSAPAASPQVVRIGCGQVVDVGDLSTGPASGPSVGEFLAGLTVDSAGAYTATATGDVEFSQESYADCAADDDGVTVTFGADTVDSWYYRLSLAAPVDTSHRDGRVSLQNVIAGTDANGTLEGDLEMGSIGGYTALGGSFGGTLSGTAGTFDLEVRFTCVVFGFTGKVPAGTDEPIIRLAAAQAPPAGRSYGEGHSCKKLFINGAQPDGIESGLSLVMDLWAAGLMQEVRRVSVVTIDDVRMLADSEAGRELFGSFENSIDIAGALGSDFMIAMGVTQVGSVWLIDSRLYDLENGRKLAHIESRGDTPRAAAVAMADRWTEMVDALTRAGICAEITPASAVVDVGDTREFTVEVTDLDGREPTAAVVGEVTGRCGTWKPSSGSVDGVDWRTTFTAGSQPCEESVTFEVHADGSGGEVWAEAIAKLRTEALWQFSATITFDDGRSLVTAESSGEFFVDAEFDALIGAGTGYVEGAGNARCQVNDEVYWPRYTMVGTYQVMVSGQVTERPDNAPWTVLFAPMGWNRVAEVTYLETLPCVEAGTYSNDALGYLGVGVLVSMPHWMANQPGGFLTYMNPQGDGISFEEQLIGLPGASIRARIWKPQP